MDRLSNDLHNQRKLSISNLPQMQPQYINKRQSFADINSMHKNTPVRSTPLTTNHRRTSTDNQQRQNNGSKLRQPSPSLVHAKTLSRSGSNSSIAAVSRRKSAPKLNQYEGELEQDPLNESTLPMLPIKHLGKKKSSLEKRKSKQCIFNEPVLDDPSLVDILKDELEKERALTRSIQGQKEGNLFTIKYFVSYSQSMYLAIVKDLDYFCSLLDELTNEKDHLKKKFDQQMVSQNGMNTALNMSPTSLYIQSENDDLKKVIKSLKVHQR